MTINLKTTILLSSLLAVILNASQFLGGLVDHNKDAFTPSWAYAASNATPAPSAAPSKLSMLPPAGTAPAAASAVSAPAAMPAIPVPADSPDVAARLAATGLNPAYAGLYLAAQAATGTPWQLIAAVHSVETGQSGNTSRTSGAGAEGPMQFLPATFNHYAMDGDSNGTRDITNVSDAVFTGARYLAANGAARGQYSTALYGYNHSWSYVSRVMGIASSLGL